MSEQEAALLPLFELELDVEKPDDTLHKAEIEEDSGVHLRCTVKGDANDQPGLQWLYSGSELAAKEGVQIETDNQSLISNLKLTRANAGIYECSITRKADGKTRRRRVRVKTKPAALNETLFGEVLCGPERDGYCQHGGTCLYHPVTKIISCRCSPHAYGKNCEYMSPDGAAEPVITETQYEKSITLIAGFSGILIIALIVAFFLYFKKRDQIKSRFRRSKAPPEIITTLPDEPVASEEEQDNTALSPALNKLDERIKLIKALLPARCPHCKRHLGINAKLDALSKHASISFRSSTPPALSYQHVGGLGDSLDNCGSIIRSVSDSRFPVRAAANNQNRSMLSCSRMTDLVALVRPWKERHRNSFQGKIDQASGHRPSAASAPSSPGDQARFVDTTERSITIDCHNEGEPDQNDKTQSALGLQSQCIGLRVPGIIHEMSVDETAPPAESVALLDAFPSHCANQPAAEACC